MCTCNAFTYRSCRYSHSKFEPVSVCLAVRLGLRERCQQRIVNGHPDIVRAWPVISGTCNVCFPEKAKAEEEEKKKAAEEEKERMMTEVEEKGNTAKRKWMEEVSQVDGTILLGHGDYWWYDDQQ
ncbi:hypothetical protein GGR58DRAFT_238430 [Xylaria digitata]|nr:hypothetical protein GGR58DRAFT_238430 [Xylaria digitata]